MNVKVFGDIPNKRLDEIRDATSCDSSLQAAMKLVLEGWPAGKRRTLVCTLPYFDIRDCLSVVDGILSKRRSNCDSHGSETINQEKKCPSRP